MNTSEYEFNEIKRFNGELARIEHAPLHERKEDREKLYAELVENPEYFLSACDMFIAGNYGAGSYYALGRLTGKHNRAAWIFCCVSALEYGVSNQFARGIWHKLSKERQNAINESLARKLEVYDIERGEA